MRPRLLLALLVGNGLLSFLLVDRVIRLREAWAAARATQAAAAALAPPGAPR